MSFSPVLDAHEACVVGGSSVFIRVLMLRRRFNVLTLISVNAGLAWLAMYNGVQTCVQWGSDVCTADLGCTLSPIPHLLLPSYLFPSCLVGGLYGTETSEHKRQRALFSGTHYWLDLVQAAIATVSGWRPAPSHLMSGKHLTAARPITFSSGVFTGSGGCCRARPHPQVPCP